jgi:lysophospholipase L1-like esterase
MDKKKLRLLGVGLVILLVVSGLTAYLILGNNQNEKPTPQIVRVACVGDSLTQSTKYPYYLGKQLGTNYNVSSFGAGSTTVLLNTETPYMNSTRFQSALEFQPDIVIIMLGTNDAQPNLKMYNASFVDDYRTLIAAFQAISSKPDIWIVLPPPIFSDQGGKIDPEYFKDTLIPFIEQVANQTNLSTIDVFSALASYPDYFPDGIHPTDEAAKLIADEIFKTAFPQNT